MSQAAKNKLRRRLKSVREKASLTQAEFAEKLGVPLGSLIHWENCQRLPNALALEALNSKLDAMQAASE